MSSLAFHGTTVEIKNKAVLICGNPGMGKSSLALQLIDRGALLVADDQTLLSLEEGKLMAHPPSALKGLLEVRGVGICSFPYQEKSLLALCVEIIKEEGIERLPPPFFRDYQGIRIPLLKLKKDDPLGAIKVGLKIENILNSMPPSEQFLF